jgi:hypothetical protein
VHLRNLQIAVYCKIERLDRLGILSLRELIGARRSNVKESGQRVPVKRSQRGEIRSGHHEVPAAFWHLDELMWRGHDTIREPSRSHCLRGIPMCKTAFSVVAYFFNSYNSVGDETWPVQIPCFFVNGSAGIS